MNTNTGQESRVAFGTRNSKTPPTQHQVKRRGVRVNALASGVNSSRAQASRFTRNHKYTLNIKSIKAEQNHVELFHVVRLAVFYKKVSYYATNKISIFYKNTMIN